MNSNCIIVQIIRAVLLFVSIFNMYWMPVKHHTASSQTAPHLVKHYIRYQILSAMARYLCLFCLAFYFVAGVSAQSSWPQVITHDGATVQVYEPQPEKLSDNSLTARAAVSIQKKSTEEPLFGVMWFEAPFKKDNNGNLTLTGINISKSKFADDDKESNNLLKTALEKEGSNLKITLNQEKIKETLQLEDDASYVNDFKNEAPVIYYRDVPTTLIVLDGEPVEQQDDNLKMIRVVNSPYLVVKNPDDKKYYLYGGALWYSSPQIKTGWGHVKNLPARIKSLDAAVKEESKKEADKDDQAGSFTTSTKILVSTEPAELLQTEGKPTYKSVPGSTLLYVDNSLDEIFKDVESQKNYILISGRWYNSSNLAGPWQYVAADALPQAFAKIPKGSEKDGVLANVAGTEEAEDAVMDAQIPQTAKVERNNAKCEVTYDGTPKFVPIPNTSLSLAENSNTTVMLAPNNKYYALTDGIWFISNNPNGPWEVANERPSDVEKIPANSSAYNARYVQVYYTTPQYVYVGYTPGYLGSYVYRRTVIWGTGWRYRPWHGHFYYPRPFTWGFGMHYNPWTGWNINYGLGFNWGWSHYHMYHGGWGWFGPPMYRPPYRPWGWNGGYYGHRPVNRPVPRPRVVTNRPANWNRPQPVARPTRQNNIYVHNRAAISRDKIQRPVMRPAVQPGTRPVTRPTQPVTRPTQPVTRPTQPVVRPNRPVTRPGQPATRPTQPVVRPGQPSTRPTQPSNRPRPTNPANPSVRPTTPVKKPVVRPAPKTRPATNAAPANRAPARERSSN